MATNGTFNHQDAYTATSEHSSSTAGVEGNAASRSADDTQTPPDQIGWYFVEQYYTTLSRTPDRLHLYYSKASQFVCGVEAQVATVTVGRHAIQERIAELEFQDTKVRVSNVDSQGSGDHIVIQVIGECSHKAGEPKKFVQTFVLAKQPTGYFVLNDMLRYIDEEAESEPEPEEEVAGQQQTVTAGDQVATKSEPATAPPAYEDEVAQPTTVQLSDADQKLAEAEAEANTTDTVPAPVSEAPAAEPAVQAEEPVTQAEVAANIEPELEKAAPEVAEEAVKQSEVPKEPRPTAVPTPAEPEKLKESSRPLTWANRAAAAVPRAPVALPKTAPLTAAPAPTKPAATPVAATAPIQPSSTAQAPAASAPGKADNEWKTAETRRSGRTQPTAAPTEKENRFAYIKNVTDKVQEEDLRRDLEQYGTLDRLEMNTMRSCAFADFNTPPDWGLIAKNGPLLVAGERVIVEPRRPRANPGGNYNRGGAASGRGRGGYDRGARSGSQGNGRGGFSGGSIRGGPPRGRGNIPVSNV